MTPEFLRRFGPWILLVAAVVTAACGWHAAHLGVEHDNESLRTTEVHDVRTYARFREMFGSDEDIVVAIGHERLLEPEGLELVADLTREIEAMDGVRSVWSLANAEELVAGEAGAEPRRLPSPREGAAAMGAALDRNPDFTGWLVSADRRAAGLIVEIEDRPGDAAYRSRLTSELRALAPKVAARGGEMHVTGVPVQKIDVSAYVERDQAVLLPAAVVVLGLTLALFLRHVSGVVVPLAVAGITVVWTTGLYSASGHALNAITALLPPVLLVVALATTIHVYDAWLQDRVPPGEREDREDGPAARAARAVRAVLVPALLCAVTTAQGFLSLSVGDLPAVQQFGLFAAFGSLAAFVVAMTVVPAALAHVAPPPHRTSDEHGAMLRVLDATARLATTHPRAVLAVFGGVTAVLAAGIPLVRSNTDLIGFLREDAPLRRDTEWIDRRLGGALPIDFLVERRDGRPVADLETLRRLEELERTTAARPAVAGTTSIVALVRQVNRADGGGGALALPDDPRRLGSELDLLDESGHGLVRRFASEGMTALRLTVRLHAVGSAVSEPLVARIREDAARLLGPDIVFTPTGSLWQVVRDSEGLVRQQVTSFASAILLVVAAIGILMRSFAFTLLAMIPNVMPIVWTGGLMGYAGIDLSTGTAMIASAVLGLVVDDTIHYLSYFRRVHRGDVVAAIHETSRAVGAPVTVASASLVLGFWVGALGSFLPTIYFSLLTGLTMITGVVCDLLVLPACLVLMDRRRDAPRRAAAA